MSIALKTKDLVVGWPGFSIEADDFDFRFEDASNCLAVVGASGAGKSTIMQALAGMMSPKSGTITWDFGDDSAPLSWSAGQMQVALDIRSKNFGYALQSALLPSFMTLGETLRSLLVMRGRTEASAQERAQKVINELTATSSNPDDVTIIDKRPDEMSGGQRQRAMLATAIVHNPRVLFADEPTSNLDDDARDIVLKMLERWVGNPEIDRAIVFITHRKDEPTRLAGEKAALAHIEVVQDFPNRLTLPRSVECELGSA